MNEALAEFLKSKLTGEVWISMLAGLVRPIEKIQWIDGEEGQGRSIRKRYPLAASVSTDCDNPSVLKELLPNDIHSGVVYFEDYGSTFIDQEGSKRNYNSVLRLVCWMNLNKIKNNGAVSMSSIASARIISLIQGNRENSGILQKIRVNQISEVAKGPEIFYPKYSMDPATVNYLVYPFDYFALDVRSEFTFDENCIPEIEIETKCETL